MKTLLILVSLFSAVTSHSAEFKLKTTSFDPKKELPMKHVYNGFGCTGENISPALEWEGAPKDTKSFAITVYDPDAPTGSGWWHWTVVNIPASVTKIEAGASNSKKLPEGSIEGRTDFGKPGFGGACPPVGDKAHRYIFTIWALKTERLEGVNNDASGAMVGYNLNFNSLGKSSFTVEYGRK